MAITTYGQADALAVGALDHLAATVTAGGTGVLTAWVPGWMEVARGELARMADEATAEEGAEAPARGELAAQLRDFVTKVQHVWGSYSADPQPSWLRPSLAMRDSDFYAAFFAGLAAADAALQTEVDRAPLGGTRSAAEATYAAWQAAGEASASASWQRIQSALDIRACAQGALRLCGLTHADIRGA